MRIASLAIATFGTAIVMMTSPAAAADSGSGKLRLYVGTYTRSASKGIYRLELDLATGQLSEPVVAAEAENPSFVAIHPSAQYLYAVNEQDDGAVTAFAIDSASGELRKLNQKPTGGAAPCHVVVDRAGRHALFANYGGGSAGAYALERDGSLGERTAFVQHSGSSVNPARQQGPHAHSINLDAANRYAVVCDLGLDKVLVYRYDADRGTLTANDPPAAAVAPGSGPRHFAFHPDGRHAYVNNEITLTETAFDYDADRGVLSEIQTLSTLPAGDSPDRASTAETVAHPSGKFLYVSNRGHNSIAVFAIDPQTGKLTPRGHASEGIAVPRNFAVEPGGKWLVACNQAGDSLVTFAIDQETGALKPTGHSAAVPMPVCVRFMPEIPDR